MEESDVEFNPNRDAATDPAQPRGMAQRVRRFEERGQTREAFCAQAGLSVMTLLRRSSRFREQPRPTAFGCGSQHKADIPVHSDESDFLPRISPGKAAAVAHEAAMQVTVPVGR